MRISIICVGKLKEKFFRDAVAEYTKRLSRFTRLEITEIPDERIADNASEKEKTEILKKEGAGILSALKPNMYTIAMCVEGKTVSSENLSEILASAMMTHGSAAFIIGGSLGLSDEVKRRADMRISFGRITLPHQLMRVVLCEQIYRGFKIMNNESYHK